eukprot:7981443-Alexandrium_andersonii.AAC.1
MADPDLLPLVGAHQAPLATHSAQPMRVVCPTTAESDTRPERGRLGLGHLAGATGSGAPGLVQCRRRH